MAETLRRSSENLITPEKEMGEALKRLNNIREFVESHPDSPLLPELHAMLQQIVDERKPVVAEAEPEDDMPDVQPSAEDSAELPEAFAPEVIETPVDDTPLSSMEDENKPRLSFERARETSRPFSDEFILDALSGDLQKQGGERAGSVKEYFDSVPADASDKEFATTNGEVIQFRDELTDFVATELKITASPAYRAYLEERKQAFLAKLEADKQAFRTYVQGREARKDLQENRAPTSALDFYGMTVMVKGGSSVDLLELSIKDIYANLFVQREIREGFVHWSSDAYVEKKIAGDKPKMTKRIYLNPRPQDAVRVFTDVIHAAQDAGLAVKGKILDRTYDSLVMKAYDSVGENFNTRGDGIVLYATDEEAEKLLTVAESIYDAHESAFAGRGLSSVPFELAPGLGIGDEPTHDDTALTRHRSDAVERVLQKIWESGEADPMRQVRMFRSLWQAEADLENIKADNPAFNR